MPGGRAWDAACLREGRVGSVVRRKGLEWGQQRDRGRVCSERSTEAGCHAAHGMPMQGFCAAQTTKELLGACTLKRGGVTRMAWPSRKGGINTDRRGCNSPWWTQAPGQHAGRPTCNSTTRSSRPMCSRFCTQARQGPERGQSWKLGRRQASQQSTATFTGDAGRLMHQELYPSSSAQKSACMCSTVRIRARELQLSNALSILALAIPSLAEFKPTHPPWWPPGHFCPRAKAHLHRHHHHHQQQQQQL